MFDCIIVGAGPAGGSAAYHLAKAGRSVIILEKESLPRYKPCGGGVSPVVQEWFDFDFSPAISLKVDSISYSWKRGDPVQVDLTTQEPIWMVRRDIFDHFLVKQALNQGATLQDCTAVDGIEFKNGSWHVKSGDGVVTGRYLIAADGAKGPMAKWLGFQKRQRCVAGALEVEVPVDQQNSQSLHLEFGSVKNGYAWNFPKMDGYSIGAGSFFGGVKQNLRNILAEYSTLFDADLSTGKQWGHPICLWDGHQKLHTDNALLAGEAACVVDPFTAEGIRPSIFSGIQAAKAVDRAVAGDLDALEQYTQAISEEWGTQMMWARRLAQAFYRVPKIGYEIGVKRPSSTVVMSKVMAGELRYSDVVKKALQRLGSGFLS